MTKVEMKEVVAYHPPVEVVAGWIKEAGTKIGSVHFIKRSNNKLRKMCYRLHVKSPSVAKAPNRTQTKIVMQCIVCGATKESGRCAGPFVKVPIKVNTGRRSVVDLANDQMTVLDVNAVVRNSIGDTIGRGAWRTIALENVTRICNNKTVYTIKRDYK